MACKKKCEKKKEGCDFICTRLPGCGLENGLRKDQMEKKKGRGFTGPSLVKKHSGGEKMGRGGEHH